MATMLQFIEVKCKLNYSAGNTRGLEKMFLLRRKPRYSRKVFNRFRSTDAPLASSVIRNRFLEYFVNEKDHTFVRSSPIRPISDATIPFVNAGMVQVSRFLNHEICFIWIPMQTIPCLMEDLKNYHLLFRTFSNI